MEPLKVAVIGVGHLGRNHARCYSEIEGCELVAVVDRDLERSREIAKAHSGPDAPVEALSSFDSIVDRGDAASVAVPPPQPFAVAQPFLEAGKAVLVEKPMAATLEEADAMIELSEQSGSVLQVGHIERFNACLSAALPYLDQPLFIECERIHPFSLRSTDVSVVLDLMIHDIDLILHMTSSEVERVDAVGASVLSPTEDLATARMVFENGCTAMVKTSRVALNRSRKIRVFSKGQYISLDLIARTGLRIALSEDYDPDEFLDEMGRISAPEGETAFLEQFMITEDLEIPDFEPLKAELQAFLKTTREGGEPYVTGQQGRRAMETAARIEESIHAHRDRIDAG